MGKEQLKSYVGAFIVGGLIGMFGHALVQFYFYLGLPMTPVAFPILVAIYTLALIGGILTYFGPYNKLADIGGMGAAVPMAGLAQGIAMMIWGPRAEGVPNGQAVKMGLIGPAKIFGSAFALGLILALVKMFVLKG